MLTCPPTHGAQPGPITPRQRSGSWTTAPVEFVRGDRDERYQCRDEQNRSGADSSDRARRELACAGDRDSSQRRHDDADVGRIEQRVLQQPRQWDQVDPDEQNNPGGRELVPAGPAQQGRADTGGGELDPDHDAEAPGGAVLVEDRPLGPVLPGENATDRCEHDRPHRGQGERCPPGLRRTLLGPAEPGGGEEPEDGHGGAASRRWAAVMASSRSCCGDAGGTSSQPSLCPTASSPIGRRYQQAGFRPVR